MSLCCSEYIFSAAIVHTSALVSLAVSRADAVVGTDVPDPLQYLLTSCEVFVPSDVVAELRDITQCGDVHAAAANNVLAARGHYTVKTMTRSRPCAGTTASRSAADTCRGNLRPLKTSSVIWPTRAERQRGSDSSGDRVVNTSNNPWYPGEERIFDV